MSRLLSVLLAYYGLVLKNEVISRHIQKDTKQFSFFVSQDKDMKLLKVFPVTISVSVCILIKARQIVGFEQKWTGWNCENLIADECELNVVEGEVDVRGLKVHYWKYSRNTRNATLPTENLPLSPIIFIHGGPSLTHNYGLPLKKQACRGEKCRLWKISDPKSSCR